MIESLIFLIVESRPDIAFIMSIISCFAKNPTSCHIKVVKTILQYLKSTKTIEIIYGDKNLIIKSNLDFD